MPDLRNKRGLVFGIANDRSVASGCAKAFVAGGAELAATYLNVKAEPYVRAVTGPLQLDIVLPCDVRRSGDLDAVFDRVRRDWGRLDFLLHAIAYAPKADLQGRLVDCSAEGFAEAMAVSVHSFVHMAKLAEPLMLDGGCLLTVTFYGSERVVDHYSLMGPVKAALESVTRYLAVELAPKGIRVHALSPGPIRTRAAGGIAGFEDLLHAAETATPEPRLATIADVGALAAFLVSDPAAEMTGTIIPVDGGLHLRAGSS